MTMTSSEAVTTADPGEALKAKKHVLARVRAKKTALEEKLPGLARRRDEAKAVLDQAKLAALVAAGTPGFEDDLAAERSIKTAQEALDAACQARDAAEEQLEFCTRGEKQLDAEVGQLATGMHQAHLARSKALLQGWVKDGVPVLSAFLSHLTALRALNNDTTWPSELGHILEMLLDGGVGRAIKEGHKLADRVRSGGEVAP